MISDSTDYDFNWVPDHPREFESLWSVVHKFCFLNATTGSSVFRHFCSREGRAAFVPTSSCECKMARLDDLRFSGKLDVKMLGQVIRAPAEWFQTATMDSWCTRLEARSRTVPFLRFCPVCIQSGYHTLLSQRGDERYCSMHNMLLEDSCPRCGRRIPYAAPSNKCAPYSCYCGWCLWPAIYADVWPKFKVAADFEEYARNRLSCHKIYDVSGWSSWTAENNEERHLPTAVISRVWPEGIVRIFQSRRGALSLYLLAGENYRTLYEPIFALYRCIRRKVLRRRINSCRRWARLVKIGTTPQQLACRGCPVTVLSSLIWVSYWEARGDLQQGSRFFVGKDNSPYAEYLRRSNVVWRFLQHTPLVLVRRCVTTADIWMLSYAMASVAAGTFRAAFIAASQAEVDLSLSSLNRDKIMEQINPSFMRFTRSKSAANAFSLAVTGT